MMKLVTVVCLSLVLMTILDQTEAGCITSTGIVVYNIFFSFFSPFNFYMNSSNGDIKPDCDRNFWSVVLLWISR